MATQNISCRLAGSGLSSYGEYSTILYLGGGYRGRVYFDCSDIPSGATVTGVTLYMTHGSSVYAGSQYVSFSAASSGNWNYSIIASGAATSVQSNGNTYKWSLSPSLGQAMVDLGSGYLHMSSVDTQARPYSSITIAISYTAPKGKRVYRWDGAVATLCNLYRWTGNALQKVFIFDGDIPAGSDASEFILSDGMTLVTSDNKIFVNRKEGE